MKFPRTLDLIIARLNQLFKHADIADWRYEVDTLGLMIQEIDKPGGWDALERMARQTDVGHRLEIFHVLGHLEVTGQRKRHHIEFLARFLNDDSVCDFSQTGAGLSTTCSDFDLKRVTVRDSALRHIAGYIGIRRYP